MNTSDMKIKPFFCFYGGKWRAAKKYPSPQYDTIIEPFAGAAGYSVRNYENNIKLYDKDPTIVELWKYLISSSKSDIMSLPLIKENDNLKNMSYLSSPEKSLIGFWLNKGSTSPAAKPSSWMKSGLRPNSFWGEAIRNRIAEQVSYINHWSCECRSFDKIKETQIFSTWFVDPPYQKQGHHYRCSSNDINFDQLAAWCRNLKGQTIVCECEGATWLPFKQFQTIKSNPSRFGGKCSKEVIWTG